MNQVSSCLGILKKMGFDDINKENDKRNSALKINLLHYHINIVMCPIASSPTYIIKLINYKCNNQRLYIDTPTLFATLSSITLKNMICINNNNDNNMITQSIINNKQGCHFKSSIPEYH